MDVLAHTLWAAVAAKGANLKLAASGRKPVFNVRWTAFWGVFPDLFAFAPLFAWLIFSGFFRSFPFPAAIVDKSSSAPFYRIFAITGELYNLSHSLLVFGFIFALCWFFSRRMIWSLSGWLLHIVLDIPSHSFRFYPTPFLWPLSDFKVNGISWAEPWFMAVNYAALIAALIAVWRFGRKKAE